MKKLLGVIIVFTFTINLTFGAQNEEIVPSANLVVEGIPRMPASLAQQVSRYTNAYGFRLAGWDVNKREVLLKNLASSETWILRVESGSSPKILTWVPSGAYDVYYHPQGKFFIYNKDINGNDSFQFYLYDLVARKSTLITDGKSRNTEPVWSKSGDWVVYCSSPPNGNGVDLSVINPLDPKSNRLIAEGRGNYLKAYDWSPDDRQVVFCDFASNTASTLWILEVASGKKILLSPKGEKESVYYDAPQFSKDGKGIYVISDQNSEFRRLVYIDLATRQYKSLSEHINWDVEEFKLSPDGKALAYVTNEDGDSRLRILDTKTGKGTLEPTLLAGVISDLRWHSNSLDLAFNLRSSRNPNEVYSVNIPTGKVEQWYKGVMGTVDLKEIPDPGQIEWKSFDGRKISGFLYRPPAKFTGKRPVIINIHGGPEEQYRPDFGYHHNYFLNELGVALIFPNIRGSVGYGKTFHRLDNGTLRENAVKDIGALLDWIKGQPDLDAERVLVQGASYGGFVALNVAASYSGSIRGAISDSGPSNLVTFIENTAGWRRDLQRLEFGNERDPKIKEFLLRTAPVNRAARIKKPLFIIQGMNDPRVPVGEAQQMLVAVKKNGTPVWYLLAKDEGHDWSKKANKDYRLFATVLFVQEYLLKQAP